MLHLKGLIKIPTNRRRTNMDNYNYNDYFTYLVAQYSRAVSQGRRYQSEIIDLDSYGVIVKYTKINGKPDMKVFIEEGSFEGYSIIEDKIVNYLAETAVANVTYKPIGYNKSVAVGGLKVIISLIAKLVNCPSLKRGVVNKRIAIGNDDSMKWIMFGYDKTEKAHILELAGARKSSWTGSFGSIDGFAINSYININIDTVDINTLINSIATSKFLHRFVSDRCYDYGKISDEIINSLCLLSDTYVDATNHIFNYDGFMRNNSSLALIANNCKTLTANLNIDPMVITANIDTRFDEEYSYGTIANAINTLYNSFIADKNIRKNNVVID